MRTLIFSALLLPVFLLFFSCKEPIPVYHTALPGKAIDSFPYRVCGTWVGIDDVMRKELNAMQAYFPANPDDLRYVEADTAFKAPPDTAKNLLLAFNKPACEILLKPIDSLEGNAKKKIKTGVLRIVPKGLDFEFMDTLGQRGSLAILRLDAKNKLFSYQEDLFLAQHTAQGWELIMLDFHHKNLLSIRLPWFTGYDENAGSVKQFQLSMKSTSPKLKPVLNKEGKIVGMSTSMKPEEIVELMKRSDTDPIHLHRY